MPAEKLVIAAFCDPDRARGAARELRRVGFREDQLVFAMGRRRYDRKGWLSQALQKHGANGETCALCDSLYMEGQVVVAVRSQARNFQAREILVRGGGVLQFDGDAEPGQGQGT